MNRILMQALVDLIAFLALSGEDIVDEDSALAQLESTAAALKRLHPQEREEFLAFVKEASEREQDEERGELLRSLPSSLGFE